MKVVFWAKNTYIHNCKSWLAYPIFSQIGPWVKHVLPYTTVPWSKRYKQICCMSDTFNLPTLKPHVHTKAMRVLILGFTLLYSLLGYRYWFKWHCKFSDHPNLNTKCVRFRWTQGASTYPLPYLYPLVVCRCLLQLDRYHHPLHRLWLVCSLRPQILPVYQKKCFTWNTL